MTKKEKIIGVLKVTIQLLILIALILFIIYLIKSDNGVLAKINEGNAGEKLDTAIKIFSSTDGMKLDEALRSIEGLEHLDIKEETGEYNMKIDGQEFLVISREVVPEGEEKIEVQEKGKIENGEKE